MQKRSELTRQKITAAALILFTDQGYDRTGVDQICQAAGVSKGAFYHHFSEKHAVFMELMQVWLNNFDTEFNEDLLTSPDILHALHEMSGTFNSILRNPAFRLPIFLEFWQHSHRDPDLWGKAIEPYFRFQSFFEGVFRKGISENSIQEIDPSLMSRIVVAFSLGLLLTGMLDPSGCDWQKAASSGIDYLMAGIKKEKR